MKIWVFAVILYVCFHISSQSTGDSSHFYQMCSAKCHETNCTSNYELSIVLSLTGWSCEDECDYGCMWKTVQAFESRSWPVPQFFGKWPFIRILGLQEPVSVIFSLLNLYVHIRMLTRFRKLVRPDSPLYFLGHIYGVVCSHAWIWSAVFHARDWALTELMDYSCAFSLVLISTYYALHRILRRYRAALILLFSFSAALYLNHVLYLSTGRFSYEYNMTLNIIVGLVGAAAWLAWCLWNRRRMPYVWKCALYVTLSAVATLLELVDNPPIFYLIDFHAIWHLTTAPIAVLFYSFMIDDCKFLRKQAMDSTLKNN